MNWQNCLFCGVYLVMDYGEQVNEMLISLQFCFSRRNTNIGLSPHDWRAHYTSPGVQQLLRQRYVASSGKNEPYHEIWIIGGLGVKIQIRVGHRVSNKVFVLNLWPSCATKYSWCQVWKMDWLQRSFCLNCHTCWSHSTVLSNHYVHQM